jgi:uncharacterized LabA/DUF88 family protein
MRVSVFVDGFNLYYGLKNHGLKWLDIGALANEIANSGENVDSIHYFTARVDGVGDPDRPRRQQVYITALQTDPRVHVYFGSFLSKVIVRPIERVLAPHTRLLNSDPPSNLAEGEHLVEYHRGHNRKVKSLMVLNSRDDYRGSPSHPLVFAHVHTREEKGSDVNLATQLLHRGWNNEYDKALVVSNDSDLCEPIRIVKNELGKTVTICHVRQGRQGVSQLLKAASSGVYHVRRSLLNKSQFPDSIVASSGVGLKKPSTW